MSALDYRFANLGGPPDDTSATVPAYQRRAKEVNDNLLKRIHELKRLLCDIQDELEQISSRIEQIL
jgi:hypothetical protein